MGTNDKVAKGIEDVERDDMNRVICGGVDGESDGVEAVVLERGHEIFDGVPFAVFVESVFRGERGRAPDALHAKRKRGDLGRGRAFMSLTSTFYSWARCVGQTRRSGWTDYNSWVSNGRKCMSTLAAG